MVFTKGQHPYLWTIEEKLKLLELFKSDNKWDECSRKMHEAFPDRHFKDLFSPTNCHNQFERIIHTAPPLPISSNAGYNLKALVDLWYEHYQKELDKEQALQLETCTIDIRKCYGLIERLVTGMPEMSDEQLVSQLHEARAFDATRESSTEFLVNAYKQRITACVEEGKLVIGSATLRKEIKRENDITDLEHKMGRAISFKRNKEIEIKEELENKTIEFEKQARRGRSCAANKKEKKEEGINKLVFFENTPRRARSCRSNKKGEKKEAIENEEEIIQMKNMLLNTWQAIHSHRSSSIFLRPVTEREAPGYSKTIRQRMDLQTLKNEIESGTVNTPLQMKHKLMNMYANAVMYNSTGYEINSCAKEMARNYWRELGRLVDKNSRVTRSLTWEVTKVRKAGRFSLPQIQSTTRKVYRRKLPKNYSRRY